MENLGTPTGEYYKSDYYKADLEHTIHGASNQEEWRKFGGEAMVEGHGVRLKNADGKEYLIAADSRVVGTVGYGRKDVAQAAYDQMCKLEFYPVARTDTHNKIGEAVFKLLKVAPKNLDHFLFTNCGTEAVEQAIRLAWHYWFDKGKPEKIKIISRLGAYHGALIGTTSVTGIDWYKVGFPQLLPQFIHIPTAFCYRCPFGKEYPNCDFECVKALEETIEREGEDTIAAFLVDTAMFTSGGLASPPEYFPMVRKVCSDHDILLIDDETVAGWGRTGKWWGLDNWPGVEADMMCQGKGILSGYANGGAVFATDEITYTLGKGTSDGALNIAYTMMGSPVQMALLSKILDIFEEEKIVENAARLSEHLRHRLAELKDFPHVGDIRQFGTLVNIEFVKDKTTKEKFVFKDSPVPILKEQAKERGVIFSGRETTGTLRMSPPLVMTIDDLDICFDTLKPLMANLK